MHEGILPEEEDQDTSGDEMEPFTRPANRAYEMNKTPFTLHTTVAYFVKKRGPPGLQNGK